MALLAVVAGCKEPAGVTGPTASSSLSTTISGNWSAVLSGLDAAGGNGRLTVTFDQRIIDSERSLLLGTWTLTSPDQSSMTTGTVSGVVAGTAAMIELAAARRPPCQQGAGPFELLAGSLSLNLTVGTDRLAGTVSAFTCAARFDSTIELRR